MGGSDGGDCSEINTVRKTQRNSDKKADRGRAREGRRGGTGGARQAGVQGAVGPAEGQAWTGGGDGWRAHQFLKAKAQRAAESVKFTLLISCNNL